MQPEQYQLQAELEERHWWFTARRHIIRSIIQEVLSSGQRQRIVDFGCGTGANIASLSTGHSCVGIDPSKDALQWARKRFPRVRFLCGGNPAEFCAEFLTADLILLSDVLEHVSDDRQLFSEILKVTRPGTLILVTVPADMKLWSMHDISHGHFRRYDMERLEHLWSGVPVKCRFSSYFNSRLYPAVRLIRRYCWQRCHTYGKMNTDLKLPSPFVNRILHRLFAGEARALLKTLRSGKRRGTFLRGVSIVAILERA